MRRRSFWLVVAVSAGAGVAGFELAAAQTASPAPRPAQPSSPSPAPAPAPISSEPQSTTATYGDWVLRCVRAADQPQKFCEVAQTLEVKGQGVVAQIALAHPPGKEPLRMTVVLPTNVSLTSGVRVSVGDKDENPAELLWKRCTPGGCAAEIDVREDLLRSWRAQSGAGEIRYILPSAKPLALSFSFRGLGVALDNLPKAGAAQ
jgi:invasion protein IalB